MEFVKVHSKASGSSIDYHFEEKRLIKELAEQTIFDKDVENASMVLNDYIAMIKSEKFTGENSSHIPNSIIHRINLVDCPSIALAVNERFANNRDEATLKRY